MRACFKSGAPHIKYLILMKGSIEGTTKIIIFALSQGEGHFGFEALYKIVIFL